MSQDPVVIVTTSWDDGHSADLRVAELLAAHGLKATFYVAFNHPNRKEISDGEIRMLYRAGMEIGSHTLTHRLLTGRPAAEVHHELKESRMRLEDIVGAPVTAFSYPQGAFTAVARAALAETGYRLGRSTIAFRTAYDFDPFLMPISLEFCPYSRFAITRHALRDGNLAGLTHWARVAKLETDPLSLARLMFDEILLRGGIFHVNARSWEIDKNKLWDQLDDMARYIAGHPAIHHATNSEVLSFYN
ncbi:MAG: polysaccharide deacetylase family protein [Alphaproteobacteria bacterium]|nr:polysaccharide deacetylase family protein [Alphaproteobacteria bacterium]